MKLFIPVAAGALAFTAVVNAQDSTVRSSTTIKADDAKVVTMNGCLRQDTVTGRYSLVGAIAAAGDEVRVDSKVKTEVDKDDVKVTERSRVRSDDGAVGTTGTTSTYMLVPRSEVNLSQHVDKQVQLSAVIVEAGKGDAEVKVETQTKVDPDNAPDSRTRTRAEVELPKSPAGAYSVITVKQTAASCTN